MVAQQEDALLMVIAKPINVSAGGLATVIGLVIHQTRRRFPSCGMFV